MPPYCTPSPLPTLPAAECHVCSSCQNGGCDRRHNTVGVLVR